MDDKQLNGILVILVPQIIKEIIVNDYFEFLHTTGEKYIINDIDLFIQSKQSV